MELEIDRTLINDLTALWISAIAYMEDDDAMLFMF
jgi:hypothetical protein